MRSPLPYLSPALALALAACHQAAPPPVPAAPAQPAAAAAAPPATPGRLRRPEVDEVLVQNGPPWILRRVLSEEVLRKDGKFSGWRLVGLPEEWRSIDLKPGDVVTRVNGLPLETPDEAWEAWKSVGRAPELKLSLVRDGTPRELTLPIDGAPSSETTKLLGRDVGPQRAAAPAPRRSVQLGGAPVPGSADAPEDDAY